MDCEILIAKDYAARGDKIIRAMHDAAQAAGVRSIVSTTWRGKSANLMTYGLGHLGRMPWTNAHLANGGRVIAWDLGYWDREGIDAGMRVTMDQFHPWRLIKPESPERFDQKNIALREDYDPKGPIILIGLGKKQRRAFSIRGQDWEKQTLAKIRQRFPGRRIVFRPKRPEQSLEGCQMATGAIEETLRGASLVVAQHSNCAIDACVAGIPVICEDGAAYALYKDNPQPTHEQRLEFLRSVAHWQYRPSEAKAAWAFLKQFMLG